MSEHETQATPALSQPPQEHRESLIDMLHISDMTSQIVNAVGNIHTADAEGDAETMDCDDHVLIFDNPFKGAMDGDDDENL
ncbi:hypothetical protein AbraIFM66950_011449 [Aspergillus brasiliensis]|nr:hypothetical protein AbraIFM66950_011449 [Aspergillus brasiliensis]